MDESWWLWEYGLKGSSKYFFIVFLITKDSRISLVALRNTEKWMIKKWIKHTWWVFHANKELPQSRIKLLENSQWKDFTIAACYIDKENTYWLTKDPHLLYNNMVCKLLNLCIDKNLILRWEKIQLIASRRETNRYLNLQFENQIKESFKWILNLDIKLMFSNQEKWLQHVDIFAYSIFHKHEFNNYKLYNMFANNIKIEEEIKWKEKKY